MDYSFGNILYYICGFFVMIGGLGKCTAPDKVSLSNLPLGTHYCYECGGTGHYLNFLWGIGDCDKCHGRGFNISKKTSDGDKEILAKLNSDSAPVSETKLNSKKESKSVSVLEPEPIIDPMVSSINTPSVPTSHQKWVQGTCDYCGGNGYTEEQMWFGGDHVSTIKRACIHCGSDGQVGHWETVYD